MGRLCVDWALKVVNSVMGMAGMAMIIYSLWMVRLWYAYNHGFWADRPNSAPPWFIYSFLVLGIFLCLLTCSGYIAAETANRHCLCYVFIFTIDAYRIAKCLNYTICTVVLVMLEAAIAADVFLNKNWEEDLPEDPTRRFDEFKNFVRHYFKTCEWMGLSIVAAQVMCIFLAMVLRALGPDRGSYYDSDDDCEVQVSLGPDRGSYYDSDDDCEVPVSLPLLWNQGQHTASVADSHQTPKNDSWNIRIHER